MKTVEWNTQEAPNKWWAARDASMRNYANSTHYTAQQRLAAERMKLALGLVYHAKNIYIAYGKRGISLKVDGGRVIDRRELTLLEAGWDQAGVVKRVTPQGVTYRLNIV
jgi:hypothetical protein